MTMHALVSRRLSVAVGIVILLAGCARPAGTRTAPTTVRPGAGGVSPATKIALIAAEPAATSRDALTQTVERMRARLAKDPADSASAVTLADTLLRLARVTGNAGLANQAEQALDAVLARRPDDYPATRMRVAVYLSAHRFRDALGEAERARVRFPNDAWNYGALGDAHLELGEYDAAFAAFDRMAALKPNAASYARVSYARELQGDLPSALRYMTMAAEATGPQDSESIAWHYAQIGHLAAESGKLDDAARAYAHADYVFPRHPLVIDGQARLRARQGDYAGALALLEPGLRENPTPSDLALAGDMHQKLGHADQAERCFRLAESAWASDVPEPARLAKFLAEHHRRVDDAVKIAEDAVRVRRDIYTMDALAMAYFAAGRLPDARTAMKDALRTGSRDSEIRRHAAAITAAGHRP